MDSVETLIPDNEDNHLVVVLSFYEDYKRIPSATAIYYCPFAISLKSFMQI